MAQVPNRHAQLTLVLDGIGGAFLPLRMATGAARSGAVVVETRPELRTPFGIIHRPEALGPAAQSFVIETKATLDRWNSRIAALRKEGASLLEAAMQADDELHDHRRRTAPATIFGEDGVRM